MSSDRTSSSILVSFSPPFLAFVNGVRAAKVITLKQVNDDPESMMEIYLRYHPGFSGAMRHDHWKVWWG